MQTSQLIEQLNHNIHNYKINPLIDHHIILKLNEPSHRIYEPVAPQRIVIHAYLHNDTPLITTPDEQLPYKSALIWDDSTTTADTYLLNKVHQTLHYAPNMIPYLQQYSSFSVDEIYKDSTLNTHAKLMKIIKTIFNCQSRIDFIKILFNIKDNQIIRFKIGTSTTYNGIAILYA